VRDLASFPTSCIATIEIILYQMIRSIVKGSFALSERSGIVRHTRGDSSDRLFDIFKK